MVLGSLMENLGEQETEKYIKYTSVDINRVIKMSKYAVGI
jgi:hypothetical protein